MVLLDWFGDSYTENLVTEKEIGALPPRLQEQIRRSAAHHSQSGWSGFYTANPQVNPNQYRRVGEWSCMGAAMKRFNETCVPNCLSSSPFTDWLRDRVYFEGLVKRDDYAVKRLGYKAPNIFIMTCVS
jgi:hypothetical protein